MTVGDISRPSSAERTYVSSVAASESKPIDIKGEFLSIDVPRARRATDHTTSVARSQF